MSKNPQIQIDDNLPSGLCETCLTKLIESYKFQQQCFEVDRKLKRNEFTSELDEHQNKCNLSDSFIGKCDENKPPPNTSFVNSTCLDQVPDNYTDDHDEYIGKNEYFCGVCNRRFLTKHSMHRHEKTHSSNENLRCQICSKQFSRANDVKRHMTLHTGHKPYKCTICNVAFTQSGTLAQHARKHDSLINTKKEKKYMESKPHLCSICGKSFKDSSSLTIHVRRHTGDKPYSCKFCIMR